MFMWFQSIFNFFMCACVCVRARACVCVRACTLALFCFLRHTYLGWFYSLRYFTIKKVEPERKKRKKEVRLHASYFIFNIQSTTKVIFRNKHNSSSYRCKSRSLSMVHFRSCWKRTGKNAVKRGRKQKGSRSYQGQTQFIKSLSWYPSINTGRGLEIIEMEETGRLVENRIPGSWWSTIIFQGYNLTDSNQKRWTFVSSGFLAEAP